MLIVRRQLRDTVVLTLSNMCMKKRTSILLFVALIMTLLPFGSTTFAQGTVISQHIGANDPTSEGFSLSSYGSPELWGVINDLGVDAWATSVYQAGATYTDRFGDLSGKNWVLSTTLRVVTSDVAAGGDVFSAAITTGSTVFYLRFGSTAGGDPTVQAATYLHSSPVITLDGAGSTYNDFRLVYDASENMTDLWINGVREYSGLPGASVETAAGLQWSAGYQGSLTRQANWSLVSVEIIPEPSSIGLSLIGLTVIFMKSRTMRSTEWRPRGAALQFGSHGWAAIGEQNR